MTQARAPEPALDARARAAAAAVGHSSMTLADQVSGTKPGPFLRMRRMVFTAIALAVLGVGLSPVPLPVVFEGQDKLLHLFGFAGLVLSARLAFPGLRPVRLALGCLSVALLTELGQGLMSSRSASLTDMAANLLGIGLGLACAHWILGRR